MDIRDLVNIIASRLESNIDRLSVDFNSNSKVVGIRYFYLDDLLPESIAESIYNNFPSPEKMRLMSSFREKKLTSKSFDEFDSLLKNITFAIQDQKIIKLIEKITGIPEQIPDPSLYAGGLSMMGKGHFLNPHIDNSHEATRRYYRTLNLLYYVTPGWEEGNGGNLELWDKDVKNNVTIASKFNRLAVMETTPCSWHSVSPVQVDGHRCCVSNYYFSAYSPSGYEYYHVTSFSGRPEEKIKRILTKVDNRFRQGLRRIVPSGVGKKDVYEGGK